MFTMEIVSFRTLLEVCLFTKVLVTSAWPYINYVPHLGNIVSSILSADVVARYYRLKGDQVVYVTGSDEHGTPIEIESVKQNITPKELTDKNHARISDLWSVSRITPWLKSDGSRLLLWPRWHRSGSSMIIRRI